MSNLLAGIVALPLAAALPTLVWPGAGRPLTLAAAGLTLAATLLLLGEVAAAGTVTLVPGGWTTGLGIVLRADGLSAVLLAMTAMVALAATLYAGRYFAGDPAERHFWPLWLLLLTALNALFLAADLFNLYVTLELLGLAAVALATLAGTRAALEAALRYLLVGLLGSMAYLAGVALLYAAYGRLDLAGVAAAIGPEPAAAAALALMFAGLLLKTAAFPLHFWLPPAHGSAPAPVSAALSALVVKAAFYLLLRLWLDLFAPVAGAGVATLLGALGAAAVLWGSWQALRASRLKLLAAYSTVAQVGYLLLFFPLLAALPPGPAREAAFGGLVLLALTHGFAKAGFFLAAGVVQRHAGHDRIAELDGTVQRLPVTSFTLALAGVALIGLPPSGTFLAKWQLLSGAIGAGFWWPVAVVAVGTLLACAYVFRLLGHLFGNAVQPAGRRLAGEELPPLLLALAAAVALGLFAAPLWDLLAPLSAPGPRP